jgi:hypothetical protein
MSKRLQIKPAVEKKSKKLKNKFANGLINVVNLNRNKAYSFFS